MAQGLGSSLSLLEVSVAVRGKQCQALVDSGATHNFVSARVVELLGVALETDWRLPVTLATGITVQSMGHCMLSVEFANGLVHEQQFHVVPELKAHMVLGMPWLRSSNPQIDWVLGTLQLQGSNVLVHGDMQQSAHRGTKVRLASLKSCLKLSKTRKYAGSFFGLLRGQTEWKQLYETAQSAGLSGDGKGGHIDQFSGVTGEKPKAANTRFDHVLDQYPDVFESPGLPPKREITHRIDLVDENAPPPRPRTYRMSPVELAEVRKQLDELLAKGWIRPSSSPYGHPILFVRKKTGELRMCIDYRLLNKQTRLDRYPIPRIDSLLDSLQGSAVYSLLDLRSGYHQVAIEPGHEYKTAFTSRWGLFEFVVMPFGLCNAPATFQRLMNTVLREKLDVCVTVYLDDILVFSPNQEQHEIDLQWVLAQLRKHKLYVKRSKCEIGLSEVHYLGHVISKGSVAMDPTKVTAIQDWPAPTCQREVQQFLGLANYYNRFIQGFAAIAAPLSDLTGKGVGFRWGEQEEQSFQHLKQALCRAPVLAMPDFSIPFLMETDASDRAVGAVLEQDFGRGPQPIAYFSRKLIPAEQNYPVHEREQYAIVLACKRWRPYIDGQKVTVVTDHRSLIHLQTQPSLSKRQVRWMEVLAQFSLEIVYRPGSQAVVPDALSRPAESSPADSTPDGDAGTSSGELGALLDDRTPWPGDAGSTSVQGVAGTSSGKLGALVFEPSWFAQLARCQQSSPEMLGIVRAARGSDSRYVIRSVDGIDIVYRVTPQGDRPVIPIEGGLQAQILAELHDSRLAGHLGARKTVEALKQRFWFPAMRSCVESYVRSCPVCQRTKDSTVASQGALSPLPIPEGRFESWSMDFITSLPQSKDGYNAVMTVVDRLTKLCRLVPCKFGDASLTGGEVARLFFDAIVRHYGVPTSIVSDRDARFTSEFWQALHSILGTRLLLSSAFHPQTDGQTERQHRTLEQVLRAYVAEGLEGGVADWTQVLGHCEFALNASVQASTRVSPFEMVYGQPVSLPVDHLGGSHPVESAQGVVDRVTQLVALARKHLADAQDYQKRYYDRRHSDVSFEAGQQILLSTKHLRLAGGKKLGQRWVGPFDIVRRVGLQSYQLSLPQQYQQLHDVFHVSLLRKWVPPAPQQVRGVPLPVLVQGQEEWEVDRIVRHRRRRGRGVGLEYLVTFVGYDISAAEWLTEDALANAPERLAAYWATVPGGRT